VSCGQKVIQTQEKSACQQCNAVYYWKTTFRLSDQEREFLKSHQVKRMYLRYFDVYKDQDIYERIIPVPEATVQFIDSVPNDLEIVPTVFITNSLFKDCDMMEYAERLTNRIMLMSQGNNIKNVREVQLDCDWTQTTENEYFNFLKKVGAMLEKDSITLSVTIRLHQLRTKVPPVKKGVLMCYNSGAVHNPQTDNSILSANDVALYAKSIQTYDLPLDVAYPAFSWVVWFHNDNFKALLRDLSESNINLTFMQRNIYKVSNSFFQEGKYLEEGDEVRFENSEYEQIIRSKNMLEKNLTNYSVIIYHLDYNNLSKYTEDEINKIYSH
jgi:hypothetical protein